MKCGFVSSGAERKRWVFWGTPFFSVCQPFSLTVLLLTGSCECLMLSIVVSELLRVTDLFFAVLHVDFGLIQQLVTSLVVAGVLKSFWELPWENAG